MRSIARFSAVALVLATAACSKGSGAAAPMRLANVTSIGAMIDAGTAAATCPGGTSACGQSGWCCDTGTECVANLDDAFGCGTDFCCLGCGAGTPCGGGCCASGTSCTSNPGGATGCSTGLCCSPEPEQSSCPVDVAAQCPGGTRCLENHSARYCPGGFACYLPSGGVACPGEVTCPNGIDFCPEGNYCAAISGVCPNGSTSGNYCCKTYAQGGDSCDTTLCAPGLNCMTNPHCGNSDPDATNTCHGSCAGQRQCGNYCCALSEICDYSATCSCLG